MTSRGRILHRRKMLLPAGALCLLIGLAACGGKAKTPSGGGGMTPTSVAPQTERVLPPHFWGMQMHSLRSGQEEHARSAREAAALGAGFVRDEAHWHYVEPSAGVLVLDDERRANFAINKQLGLETLLILDYGHPLYDKGKPPTSAQGLEAWGRYCHFMASELRGICNYFEVWNEPNTEGFWHGPRDAVAYARLCEVAVREVRRGNPEAVVIGGALSGIDETYMRALCEATDCAALFDGVSIHPYCTPASPGQAAIFSRMESLRSEVFADSQRPQTPVWVTEIGFPTSVGSGVGERRQSEMLAQTYLLGAAQPHVESIVWYWMGPDGLDPEWAEDCFGIVRPRFSGWKPAAYPFRVLSSAMAGASVSTHIEKLGPEPEILIVRGRDREGRFLTAFYVEEGLRMVDIKGLDSIEAIPLTQAQPQTFIPGPDGRIVMSVTPMPLLLRSSVPLKLESTSEAPELLDMGNALPLRVLARGETAHLAVFRSAASAEGVSAAGAQRMPGTLAVENDPTTTPLRLEISCDSESYPRLAITAHDKVSPQVEPLVFPHTYPGASHPSSRLAISCEVVDPVEMEARYVWRDESQWHLEWKIINRTQRGHFLKVEGSWIENDGSRRPTFSEMVRVSPGQEGIGDVALVGTSGFDSEPVDQVRVLEMAAVTSEEVWTRKRFYLSRMPCHRVEAPLRIDGDLSDWPAGLPSISLGKRSQLTSELRPHKGVEDAAARVWLAWDDAWFYMAAEVADDVFSEEQDGHALYHNDGLEVYIDTSRPRGGPRPMRYTGEQYQIGLFPSHGQDLVWFWSKGDVASPGSRISVNRAPSAGHHPTPLEQALPVPRYLIEAAIPWEELGGFIPARGMELGFTVALDDDDSPEGIHPFLQDKQFMWSMQKNAWRNPSSFVSVWLAGPWFAPPPPIP